MKLRPFQPASTRPTPRVFWSIQGAAFTLALLTHLTGCSPALAAGGPGGPPPVSVAPVTQRNVQAFDDFSARLEAASSVELRSRVAGTLNQIHFAEGQRVSKGALLFSIDPRPFAAEVSRVQALVNSTRSQSELAASELVRAEKLLPMQAVSVQEIDQLRAARRNAQANLAASQAALKTAELNLSFTRVLAPISGRMSRSNLTVGNLVAVGEPVLSTLVSTDKVHAYFDASESTFLRLAAQQRAGGAAPAVLMGLADEENLAQNMPHKGTVDFIDNRLNPASGSIRVRAVFNNAQQRFTPGLSARVRLLAADAAPATLVPERAINTDQTRKVVMVVGANNIVMPREVKLGTLLGGMRVVTGVKAGELIIVDGLQRAFPGAPVTPQVLKVDAEGMPIPPAPAAPPGTAPAGPSASAPSAPKKG
jgi:RND family efflux transporter MFP subunit